MARCLRCNAGNEWIEGNAAKSVPLDETDDRIADLERQLAEANEMLEGFERAHSIVVNALNKAEAEIEAMRPVVGAAINWKHNHSWDARERLFVCITDYEARKQP